MKDPYCPKCGVVQQLHMELYCSRLHEAETQRDEARSELTALKGSRRWIPVSERLPEDAGNVLVIEDDGDIQFGFYFPKSKIWHIYRSDQFPVTITHWMPLPEPPKEEVI